MFSLYTQFHSISLIMNTLKNYTSYHNTVFPLFEYSFEVYQEKVGLEGENIEGFLSLGLFDLHFTHKQHDFNAIVNPDL